MKEELISVIVPVYNVEKYLSKCIESIKNQTYQNLEIILINDGSTDNCPKICDEYAKEDKRIKVIHKENKGVSSARNKGLDIAKGKYIIFVDSDDFLEKNMLETLYIKLIKTSSDISICNYYQIEKTIKKIGSTKELTNKVLTKKEFYNYLFYNNYFCGYLWNKLFTSKSINKIRFNEEIHILEDLVFISQVAENCNKFYYDYNQYLYNYRIREDSALRTQFKSTEISSIKAREIVLKYAEKYNCESISVIKFNLLWEGLYYTYKLKEKSNQIDCKKYRTYLLDSLKCREIKLTKKIKLLIVFVFPNTYFTIKEIIFRKEAKK